MLLERTEELARLSGLLHDPQGRVVLVRGEAGTGKSTLIESLMQLHAGETDFVVGRCDDLSTAQPLGPFWDMAEAEQEFLDPLDRGDRQAVSRTALDLLGRSLRRTVLVIEDTQWADEATLDAIKTIGRRIRSTRGLLLISYRDESLDDQHPLRGVLGDLAPADVERIRLTGLGVESVRELLEGHPSDPAEVWAMTGGNPLLVTAFAEADAGDGSSLNDLVAARLNRLTAQTRSDLRALAVVAAAIPFDLARHLVLDADRAVSEAERRGFLTVTSSGIRFRHELIRRAIETALPGSERMALNQRVLESLEEGTDRAVVAHHAREAGDIQRLARVAPEAAREAMAVGAHRQAVSHFRDLRSHIVALPEPLRAAVLEDWAQEEFYAHELGEAVRLIERAIDEYRSVGDRGGESRSLARAAEYLWFAGRRDDAEAFVALAEAALHADASPSEIAQVIETRAYLRMMAGDVTGSGQLVEQALEVAGETADERLIARALNTRGTMLNVSEYPAGLAMLVEARDRSAIAGLWYEEARALLNAAWGAIEHRDLPTAGSMLDDGLSLATRHDLGAAEHYGLALRVRMLDLTGDWDEAEVLATRLRHEGGIIALTVLPVLGAIAARRGSPESSRIASEAWEIAADTEFQRIGPAAVTLAETAWINDEEVDTESLRAVMEMGLEIGFTWLPGALAFWLWRLGAIDEVPVDVALPYAATMSGEVDVALEQWERIGSPYERALTLSTGNPENRVRAIEELETLGATAVAARIRRELRESGIEVPRGRAQTTRQNPAGLTARQLEVLGLLTEGLANAEIADRLFLSSRTVEHHVSAILAKLGAIDRVEAAELAAEAGLTE